MILLIVFLKEINWKLEAVSVKELGETSLEVLFKDVPTGLYSVHCSTSNFDKRTSLKDMAVFQSGLFVVKNVTPSVQSNVRSNTRTLRIQIMCRGHKEGKT